MLRSSSVPPVIPACEAHTTRSRRGRNEGSIFQRKDGRWCATVSLGAIGDRKYQRKSLYGNTKQDVLAKVIRFRSNQPEAVEREARNLTVGRFLHRWLDDAAAPNERAKTFALYDGVVKKHIEPRLGPVLLSSITIRFTRSATSAGRQADSGRSTFATAYGSAALTRRTAHC